MGESSHILLKIPARDIVHAVGELVGLQLVPLQVASFLSGYRVECVADWTKKAKLNSILILSNQHEAKYLLTMFVGTDGKFPEITLVAQV